MQYAEAFLHWFLVECENSWIFRAVTLGMALVLTATVAYGISELLRTFKPSRRHELLAGRLFLTWLIFFQAFIAFVGVLYMLGLRIVMV